MMSFLPTTCLGLVDMMSETMINVEYMRMKELTVSTVVPTPRVMVHPPVPRQDQRRVWHLNVSS